VRSRYIPQEVRERVLERAGYQCQFRGPDGTRCTSRTGLEIEHVKPFGIFRDHDERSLEALCGRHNGFRAERVYGPEFLRRRIESGRSQKTSVAAAPSESAHRPLNGPPNSGSQFLTRA